MKDLAATLGSLGDLVIGLGGALPGANGTAATIAGLALKAGAEIAARGNDPIPEIRAMLKAERSIADVHLDWERLMQKQFGAKP